MTLPIPPCPDVLRHRRGRRFVVVGGGRTGAAAAALLVREGAIVTVVDDGAAEKVTADLGSHGLNTADVTIVAGGITADVLAGADVIVLSPGVPRAHPALQAVIGRVAVVNELEIGLAVLTTDGAAMETVQVWAITGTNGKSTTTTMAGAIARRRDPQAFVGGNLGTPLCAAIVGGLTPGTAEKPRLLVVELSSYQLETIGWMPVTAAVVTNLTPDHLDRYPSVDDYYAAKARLLGLTVGGISLNAADPQSTKTLGPLLKTTAGVVATCHFDISAGLDGVSIAADDIVTSLTIRFGGEAPRTLAVTNALIVGHHNRQNAAAAAALAVMAGVGDDDIVGGLTDYQGIAHRLERVASHRGVSWWNDSKATNVDAAVIAVRSFGSGVHLIVGGVGKGAPYAPLVEAAVGRVKGIYFIGADAPALQAAFAERFPAAQLHACGTLEAACAAADENAVDGDHIVLSPACASFDQFRDYTQRGATFRALSAAAQERS